MRSTTVAIGDTATAAQYNALRQDATPAAHLYPHEQTTPDLTLKVESGILYLGTTRVVYAGGNSPSFTAPTTNPRIDLLTIDNAGTLARVAGAEAASPSIPAYPADKLVICEVFNRVGQTTIRDTDTAGQGYIQRDVRPFLLDGVVKTDGAQTVNGVKTFGSIPVLPASNPTSANEATRKAYVDTFLFVPIGAILAWLKTFAQRATGTNTSVSANKLIDSAANFTTSGVAVDDIVENSTDGTFSHVTAVDSATQLSLNNDIFTATSKTYFIWKTPKLTAEYAECNGQTISDAGSRYNGVATPNLNGASAGTQRFLRGKTRSGATGGEDTHALATSEMPPHTHNLGRVDNPAGGDSGLTITTQGALTNTGTNTQSTGGGAAHENRPPYFEVVWIMRVK